MVLWFGVFVVREGETGMGIQITRMEMKWNGMKWNV